MALDQWPAPGEEVSFTGRLLGGVAVFCNRFPLPILVVAVVLAMLSVGVAWKWLEFEGDRGALISEDDPLYQIQERFLNEFPDADDIVVLVEGSTADQRRQFIEALNDRLEEHPEAFRDLFPRTELPFLETGALYFLDVKALRGLIQSLNDAGPILDALSSSKGLTGLMEGFTDQMGGQGGQLESMLPFLNQVMEQLLVSLQTRGRFEYHSPWGALFFDEESPGEVPQELQEPGQSTFYLTLRDGLMHMLLLRINPQDTAAIDLLRDLVQDLRKAYPDLQVGITGEDILEYDEVTSSGEDSTRSAILSLLLVAVLFSFAFRQFVRPLMAIFALVIGVAWTIGYTTFAVGHLNLLTVTFATILIGLGIDFGIHFLYRYEEEMGRGAVPLVAMQKTMAGAGAQTLVGAFSTAVAFWAVALTGFKGVAEIGIIAGTGVLLCWLSMATVLVSLILLQDRHREPQKTPPGRARGFLSRLERSLLRRAPLVVGAAASLSLWCLTQLPFMSFDYNLLRLQNPRLESVQTELALIEAGGKTSLFAVSLVETVEEARALARRYEELPTVAYTESLAPLVAENVDEKTPLIRQIQEQVEGVVVPRQAMSTSQGKDLQSLADGFLSMEESFRKVYPSLVNKGDPEVRKQATAFRNLLDRFFSTLEGMGPGPIEDGLTSFQEKFFGDLRMMITFLQSQRTGVPVTLDRLPDTLAIRSIGTTGKLVVRVYPAANIWERPALERFVEDVKTVDPEVIGAPVMILHHTTALRRAFEISGMYALAAACLILLVHFRSVRTALLALMPLLVGVLWMVGAMSYYGVRFNPANFMGLPLILGIGLDFGIHVVHRAMEEGSVAMFNHSTGPATALSALTTIAGFGTMMVAGHQGIASLGFVLTAGVAATMISSLVVLPAMLSLIKLPEVKH